MSPTMPTICAPLFGTIGDIDLFPDRIFVREELLRERLD